MRLRCRMLGGRWSKCRSENARPLGRMQTISRTKELVRRTHRPGATQVSIERPAGFNDRTHFLTLRSWLWKSSGLSGKTAAGGHSDFTDPKGATSDLRLPLGRRLLQSVPPTRKCRAPARRQAEACPTSKSQVVESAPPSVAELTSDFHIPQGYRGESLGRLVLVRCPHRADQAEDGPEGQNRQQADRSDRAVAGKLGCFPNRCGHGCTSRFLIRCYA